MAQKDRTKLKDILDERTYRKARRRNRRDQNLNHKRAQAERRYGAQEVACG